LRGPCAQLEDCGSAAYESARTYKSQSELPCRREDWSDRKYRQSARLRERCFVPEKISRSNNEISGVA
jgi:hypothetical protein